MNRYTILKYMLEELIELEDSLNAGYNAWNDEESSPCDRAECDPSDQYIIECKMEKLREEMISILK